MDDGGDRRVRALSAVDIEIAEKYDGLRYIVLSFDIFKIEISNFIIT
jgi:hypothetical protein